MTETNDQDKKQSLGLSKPGKLVLNKTVETGQVRQSFSRGRSKSVTVEVKKKRTYVQDSAGRLKKVGLRGADGGAGGFGDPMGSRTLTEDEKAVRARVLHDAMKAEEEAAREAEQVALRKAEEDAVEKIRAEEEAVKLAAEAEEAKRAEEDAAAADAKTAPEAVVKAAPQVPKAPVKATVPQGEATVSRENKQADRPARSKTETSARTPVKGRGAGAEESGDARAKTKKGVRADVKRPTLSVRKGEQRRRAGKLTITDALVDPEERTRSLASVRRAREKEKQKRQQMANEGQKIIREVTIPEAMTVQELANRMAERVTDVVRALMKMGVMASGNQTIDADTAELVVAEFGHTPKRVSDADVEIGLFDIDDSDDVLLPRAPVVTVMGHVDHGKTSILDALREADVVSGEAGGITQHIGAYQVQLASGSRITFIDTPGHAAFTEMRARGAKVTDIVVLVVAADDGVMPQTIEAINHAKAAGVPLIVAVNKMDVEGADPKRVRMDLLQHEVVLEEFGGETLAVEVSAKERTNLDKLEEAILLQAELLDLKANPERAAQGVVVEARMERGHGNVATVLVQRGTLSVGDIFMTGSEWGRVRALIDDRGTIIESAGPGIPVEVLGLNGLPMAGDDFAVVESESRAREISEFRQQKIRNDRVASQGRGTLEEMFARIQEGGEVKELPVIVKADVHGSAEAIVGAMNQLANEEVKVSLLHIGVGGINESDVTLANASGAFIVGFNVRANPQARELAKRDGVEIRYYSIIYDVTDDIKKALSGLMAPRLRENFLGNAEVREVFNITKVGKIGGCMITEGMVKRGAKVRLLRDDVVIHEGSLSQLKRFKDDVREVKEGYDCGMAFANYQDMQVGDVIECFEIEEVAREL